MAATHATRPPLQEEATKEYRQIQYFPPWPATPDIDFRPWSTYQSTAHELELYGNPPNSTAKRWADWVSCTEQYLLQEHPWAAQGRGANLTAVFKPLGTQKNDCHLETRQTSFLGAAQDPLPVSAQAAAAASKRPYNGLYASAPRCTQTLGRTTNMGTISGHLSSLAQIP